MKRFGVHPALRVRIERTLNTDFNSSFTYSRRRPPFRIAHRTDLGPLMKILQPLRLDTALHLVLIMRGKFMRTKVRMLLAKKHLQRLYH